MAKDSPRSAGKDGTRRAIFIGIITSIIASALYSILIHPILRITEDFAVSVINVFYKGYIDSLYNRAAESPSDYLASLIFEMQCISTPLIISAIYILFVTTKYTYEIDDDYSWPRKWATRMTYSFAPIMLIVTTMLVMFSSTIFLLSGPTISVDVSAQFRRQMMALEPVISDKERKDLLGMWAEMRSRADYETIQASIKSLAVKYHRELPTTRFSFR